MTMRDLIPWNRGRDMTTRRGEELNPLLMMHREMNRLSMMSFAASAPLDLPAMVSLGDRWAGRTSKSARPTKT